MTEQYMSDDPYHWRNYAADEKKADVIRTLLGMPNLAFEDVLRERVAVINDPPTPEVQDTLKSRLGCELSTDPLQRTVITYAKSRHVADQVFKVLNVLKYILFFAACSIFVAMMHSEKRSRFLWSYMFN